MADLNGHGPACFDACMAGFRAALAVVVIMVAALFGAPLANVRTQSADGRRKTALPRQRLRA